MNRLGLGLKIALGFGLVLVLLAAVGLVGYWGQKKIVDRLEIKKGADQIAVLMLESRRSEKNFLIRHDPKYVDQVKGFCARIDEVTVATAALVQGAERDRFQVIREQTGHYLEGFVQVVVLSQRQQETDAQMVAQARILIEEARALELDQRQQFQILFDRGGDSAEVLDKVHKAETVSGLINRSLEARREEKNYILRGQDEYAAKVRAILEDIFLMAEDLKPKFLRTENRERISKLMEAAGNYLAAFDHFVEVTEQMKTKDREMVAAARQVLGEAHGACETQETLMAENVRFSNWLLGIGSLLAFLLGLGSAGLITSSLTRSLKLVIQSLTAGSDQVAAASSQVSSSSQQLAEGASEQAASVEQTSASLDEISSMTRRNSDNVRNADRLVQETSALVQTTVSAMGEMGQAMREIGHSGREISRIIKTIDEIAFQTNLLALNAAVEAARAGEVGQGFAVVADEVRNLAQRAKDAARDTAELIQGTTTRIQQGTDLVQKVDSAFNMVARNSGEVAEYIGEISSSFGEQADGIKQIHQAIGQIDQVTQRTAANSEETAAASEQLNAQAESMRDSVEDLNRLVTGSRRSASHSEMFRSIDQRQKYLLT